LSSGLEQRGKKRSREEQSESQAGTVDAPLQTLQSPSQPVQHAPVAENEEEHRNKKMRLDMTGVEVGSDNKDRNAGVDDDFDIDMHE
jgi:hypothetical protein